MKRNILPQGPVYRSGDICLFSEQQLSLKIIYKRLRMFVKSHSDWYKKLIGEKPKNDEFSLYHQLRDFYRKLKHEETYQGASQDYSWMDCLPVSVKSQIQIDAIILDSDAFGIIPTLPYTGIGYVIEEDGFVQDFFNSLKMHRLFAIRQLGFIHDCVHRVHDTSTIAMEFHHTRGLHHLDVYAIMSLIIENNSCLHSKRNLLLAAAISHDGKTPAGGDTTKLVNLELFDEEKNYKDYFNLPEWQPLLQKYNIDEQELYDVVQGKGVLGAVLDIADKIAYTARDCFMFMGMDGDQSEGRSLAFMQGKKLFKEDPYICNIWQNVRVIGDKVVLTKGKKLAKFLQLRAIMFKELYYNRASRFLEYMLSKRVIRYLLENQHITRDELLLYNDSWLERKINQFFGIELLPVSFVHSQINLFKTEEEAQKCFEIFLKKEDFLPIVDDFRVVTTNAVSKFNVRYKGKNVNFAEAYPKEAEEIRSIMTFPAEYNVYAISLLDLKVPKEKYNLIEKLKKEAT